MKTPVVRSSSPQELQLVVQTLVKEINYLEDLIKALPKAQVAQGSALSQTGSSSTTDYSYVGPQGPSGPQGVEGPPGPQGPTGNVDVYGNVDWISLVLGYKTTPTLNTTIANGDVWNYIYATSGADVTYYRLIPSGAFADAFYTTFSSGILSGLISQKPITI